MINHCDDCGKRKFKFLPGGDMIECEGVTRCQPCHVQYIYDLLKGN